MRIFDLLSILTLAAIFCGVVILVDKLLEIRQRKLISSKTTTSKTWVIEYTRSFFIILIIVLIIRSFLYQAYRVPTGSLEPTVMPGDMILVNQYDYGLHLPLWNKKIVSIGIPKRGQIALFRWPVNQDLTFIKRIIGIPGDHISYIHKELYINGKKITQKYIGKAEEVLNNGLKRKVSKYEEIINGKKYYIFINPKNPSRDFKNLIIPSNAYFMMGDNRDDSDDGRNWGFVPQDYFIGRAQYVLLNINFQTFKINWHRMFIKI